MKIKRHETLACVVIGFVPDPQRPASDFSALIIATPGEDGQLRCVGRVGHLNEALPHTVGFTVHRSEWTQAAMEFADYRARRRRSRARRQRRDQASGGKRAGTMSAACGTFRRRPP